MNEELSRKLSQAQARLESLITHDASEYEIQQAEKEVRSLSRAVTRRYEAKGKGRSNRYSDNHYNEEW